MIVQRLLAELQLKALRLPDVSNEDQFVEVKTGSDDRGLSDRLRTLPINYYWKVFDVFAEEEPVGCSLLDDLGDIYADLKEGLYFFEKGNETEAIWRWRLGYFTNWGRHLSGAQTALHQYFADQGGPVQTLSGQTSS